MPKKLNVMLQITYDSRTSSIVGTRGLFMLKRLKCSIYVNTDTSTIFPTFMCPTKKGTRSTYIVLYIRDIDASNAVPPVLNDTVTVGLVSFRKSARQGFVHEPAIRSDTFKSTVKTKNSVTPCLWNSANVPSFRCLTKAISADPLSPYRGNAK